MTLSASALSAAIKANRLASNPDGHIVNNDALTKDCDAIAAAVVAHITATGVVTVNPLGLTTGPTGGPVVGVCTGTIT